MQMCGNLLQIVDMSSAMHTTCPQVCTAWLRLNTVILIIIVIGPNTGWSSGICIKLTWDLKRSTCYILDVVVFHADATIVALPAATPPVATPPPPSTNAGIYHM